MNALLNPVAAFNPFCHLGRHSHCGFAGPAGIIENGVCFGLLQDIDNAALRN